jgi:hypothetical protein
VKQVLIIHPSTSDFKATYLTLSDVIAKAGAARFRIDEPPTAGRFIIAQVYRAIDRADVCDLSTTNANVMYQLGYAHALGKPVVVIAKTVEDVPFDLSGIPFLTYVNIHEFAHELRKMLSEALENPRAFANIRDWGVRSPLKEGSMLHRLETLWDASVIATGGEIGHVCNFLFDDQSWMIRYAVVDVRTWLSRHDVLIAVAAMDQPDWTKKTFRVHLTKEQVRHSPDVDSRKPVSRQQEIAMKEYYGWPAYWHVGTAELPSGPLPATGREFPVDTKEDPHLRSAEAVSRYEVWAEDGDIGRLDDFIVDQKSWHIGYLEVEAGDRFHSRSVLIPTRWVKSISWADHRVYLHHSQAGL